MLQNFTRNQKLLLGAAAAGLGIYVFRRRSVATAPVPVPVIPAPRPIDRSAGYASGSSAAYPSGSVAAGYPSGSVPSDSYSSALAGYSSGYSRDSIGSSASGPIAGENRTVGEKVTNAADVIGTHATAAKDDLKRLGSETRQALSSHTTQAARDVKQAAAETGAALRGERVDAAVVRETPLQATTSEHDPKRVVTTGESEAGKRY